MSVAEALWQLRDAAEARLIEVAGIEHDAGAWRDISFGESSGAVLTVVAHGHGVFVYASYAEDGRVLCRVDRSDR